MEHFGVRRRGFQKFSRPLSTGHGQHLPAFRAKFTLRAADGRTWTSAYSLATPRGPEQLRAEREQRARETEAAQLAAHQAVIEARGLSCYLLGGGGIGVDTSQWRMTSIHVHLRNDSETTASSIRVSVVEDDNFEWKKPDPLGPGEATRHLVELQGALRDAPQSEASSKPLLSYTPRIAFKLNGRQYERIGDADPVIIEH